MKGRAEVSAYCAIAGTSLLPVLAREKNARLAAVQFVAIMFGVGLMLLLLTVE